MLMPISGAFVVTVSAENTDIEPYADTDDILVPEHVEDISAFEEKANDDTLTIDQVETDIELYAADKSENAGVELYSDSQNILTLDAYDEKLSAIAQSKSKTDEELADDKDYRKVLFQRRLVEKAGYYKLTAKMTSD